MAKGYAIENDFEQADVVLINTCGFIEPAVEESFETIYEAKQACQNIIVMGCLGAQKDKVLAQYPDVAAVIGPGKRASVLRAVKDLVGEPPAIAHQSVPSSGVLLTPPHYTYLKIAEGCRHRCAFCIIPDLRGNLRSRPIDHIVAEAQDLVTRGVREIMVIAQDSSDYGFDFKDGTNLLKLCEALGKVTPRPWFRLHYVYPSKLVDELITFMQEGIILPYLDVPLQHASERILKLMKRPGNIEHTLERIEKWRAICPELTIRSNFITGFPGETEEDFEASCAFLEEVGFLRVHVFPYSRREGTPAYSFPDQIVEEEKQARSRRMHQRAEAVRARVLAGLEGTEDEVLLETPLSATVFTGYTRLYVPVAVAAPGHAAGDIVRVRLGGYDGARVKAEAKL